MSNEKSAALDSANSGLTPNFDFCSLRQLTSGAFNFLFLKVKREAGAHQ